MILRLTLCQVLDGASLRGIVVRVDDSHGQTPLHTARTVAIMRLLLDGGADVNDRDADGRTPLDVHRANRKAASLLRSLGGK